MTAAKYPLTRLVEVEWVDSCSRGRWDSLDNYQNEHPARCKTAGYLVKQDRKRLIIALSQGDSTAMHNCILDSLVIPRGCVTKIRKLR